MKVSSLLIGAAAAVTMMPGVDAYPWYDPDITENERRQLLSGITNILGGGNANGNNGNANGVSNGNGGGNGQGNSGNGNGNGGGLLSGGLLGGLGSMMGLGNNANGGTNANFLTGIFSNGNAAGGSGKVGLGDLLNAFGGLTKTWNAQDINNMIAAFQEGTNEVMKIAAANPKFPGWPKNPYMDKTADQIQWQDLYNAYNLWRGDSCGDLRPWGRNGTGSNEFSARNTPFRDDLTLENCDWGIWGPAENDQHPYQDPPPGAQRGPCPGLNTLANYGYIPRNGVATVQQLFTGVFEGLSVGPDLSGLLIMAGMIFKGDLKTMSVSIGGQVNGAGVGISQHGILEGDASVTRQDLKLGNNWALDPNLLQQYKNEIQQYGNNDVTPRVQAESRYRAYTNSKNNNNGFDFNPLRAIVAYAESGFAAEVFRGQNSRQTATDIDYWFGQSKFPPYWSRRNVPMTAGEIITWGMIFYKEKPTNPGTNIGFGFMNSGTNWLGSGTVQQNGCNFLGFIKGILPNGWKPVEAVGATSGLNEFQCN